MHVDQDRISALDESDTVLIGKLRGYIIAMSESENTLGKTPRNQRRLPHRSACDKCRTAKRKCNGASPCATCERYQFDCSYTLQQRKLRKLNQYKMSGNNHGRVKEPHRGLPAAFRPVPFDDRSTPDLFSEDRDERLRTGNRSIANQEASLEGAANLLALNQWTSTRDSQALTAAWNLGIPRPREDTDYGDFVKVSELFLEGHVRRLSEVYFEEIHPLFGFLSKMKYDCYVDMEYSGNHSHGLELQEFEPVICGVIALGSLFSRQNEQMQDITGREALEGTALKRARIQLLHTDIADNTRNDATGVYSLIGWALRTIYMRASATPRHAWLGCCRAMHIAELLNLHDESKWPPLNQDYDDLRCLFWTLESLNALFSLEIGRSKIEFSHINCRYPERRDEKDLMPSFLELYEKFSDQKNLCVSRLEEVLEYQAPNALLSLEQANVSIILFRKLWPTSNKGNLAQRVFNLGWDSLSLCHELAKRGRPWWNVANLPFQLACFILALDNSTFIAALPSVFETIQTVAGIFQSAEMQESTEILRNFLCHLRQKKENEINNIDQAMNDIDATMNAGLSELGGLPFGFEDMIAGELMPAIFGLPF